MGVGRCFLRTNSKPTGMRSNRLQQHSLVDKGSYVPGIIQSCKTVAASNSHAFFVQVREIPLATHYLH